MPRTDPKALPHKEAPLDHVRAFARTTARASARVLLRPRSHTTAFDGCTRRMQTATSTWPTKPGTELPNPEAAVLPALVLVFNSEVTSLGRVTARSAWVCAAFRQAILSKLMPSSGTKYRPDFPIRNQKLKVPLPYGCSQFGSVSSESHWQALSYVFDCAFHG